MRAFYENKILEAYSAIEFDENVVTDLVKTYTELRLREAMLSDGFRMKTLSHNGYIYTQLLREKIFAELGVDKPAEEEDLQY